MSPLEQTIQQNFEYRDAELICFDKSHFAGGREVKSFTFFKFRHERDVPSFEIEQFENIDVAKDHALFLLRRTEYRAIEIWDGGQSIEIERGSMR